MAASGDQGAATAMANDTEFGFSKGHNRTLNRLKACMGRESYLLESLKFDRTLVSLHQDHSRILEFTTLSPHRIEIGTANRFGKRVNIYAYLVKNYSLPQAMRVACYTFLSPHEKGHIFELHEIYIGGGTLHESFSLLLSPTHLNTMLKLYFIDQGSNLNWVHFGSRAILCVKELCQYWAQNNEASTVLSERKGSASSATYGPAEKHKEVPDPSTIAVKRERHSTPPISRDDSIATLSDPNAAIHPAPHNRPKKPTHPPTTPPTPPKPKIDGTSLTTAFTLPLTTARATEKSLDKKILTKKRKLAENSAEIERLWALIEVADKKKLKLEGKIKDYEGRREDAQKTQRELVEGLDPMLRRFIRVAREVGVGEEDEEMEEGGV